MPTFTWRDESHQKGTVKITGSFFVDYSTIFVISEESFHGLIEALFPGETE
jgi:hypothetical protein